MAQPESQRSDFEESNSSNANAESTSIEGSRTGVVGSLQSDVADMLDSMDGRPEELQAIEKVSDLEIDKERNTEDQLKTPSSPTSDQLLMQAGSILNGTDIELSDIKAEEEPESDSVDYEEEGLMSMPDPQSLMQEAGAESEGSDPTSTSIEESNVVGRAGDLPPPPPAPVALEEDEIEMDSSPLEVENFADPEFLIEPNELKEADNAMSKDERQVISEDKQQETSDDREPESEVSLDEPESFEDDFLLDDDDSDLVDGGDGEILLVSDQENIETLVQPEAPPSEEAGGSSQSSNSIGESVQVSKGVLLRNSFGEKCIRSIPLAAGLALVGIGLILLSFKNEVFEFIKHRDIQGSSLNKGIAAITTEVFYELGPDFPYRMVWLDSDVERISDSEFRINARIGAELKIDLYQPVEESFVFTKLPFDSEALSSAASLLESLGDTRELGFPKQSWNQLYKHSASKGEIFPMDISYRLLKNSSDWELSRLRVKEGDVWSRGRPKDFFGSNAMDIDSSEFPHSFRAFEKAGVAFLKKAGEAEKAHLAKLDEAVRLANEKRENLIMALSQGSSFRGMVIVGVEGSDAREISLIITETRNSGGLIKGILKLDEDRLPAKHFTGILDLVESEQGIHGQLNLTTIAFAGQSTLKNTPPFFNPGTVSRIKLHTDGYRMEGDAGDISLRLIRSL